MKVRTEDIIDSLTDKIIGRINALPYLEVERPQIKEGKGDEEQMVLMISDMQVGLHTPSTNPHILERRMRNLVHRTLKILSLHRRVHPVHKLNIFMLGDIVHNERVGKTIDLDNLELTLSEQMFDVATPLLVTGLQALAPHFPEGIDVYMVQGNHGRFSKFHSYTTNMDGVVYRFVVEKLANYKNVHFFPEYEFFYKFAEIYGWKFLLIHGDQIPMHLNLPWYGITTRGMRLQGSIGDFNYLVLAHFHVPSMIHWNDVEIFVNGCWVSDDQWPLRTLGMSGIPKQLLFFVHPKQGISARYLIKLD